MCLGCLDNIYFDNMINWNRKYLFKIAIETTICPNIMSIHTLKKYTYKRKHLVFAHMPMQYAP